MSGIIKEVVAILYFITVFAIDAEWSGELSTGPSKMDKVVAEIMREVEDKDGIYVTSSWKLNAIRLVLPIGIRLMVKSANKLGLFTKSS